MNQLALHEKGYGGYGRGDRLVREPSVRTPKNAGACGGSESHDDVSFRQRSRTGSANIVPGSWVAAEADLPVTTDSHRNVRAVGDSVTGAFGMERGAEYRRFSSRLENYNDNRICGQTHSEDHKSCDYMISGAADRPGTDLCRTGSRAPDPHRYDPPGTDIYRTGRRVTGPYLNNSHKPDYRRTDSCGIDQRGDKYVRSERDNRLYRPPSVHIPNSMAVLSM